MHEDRLRMTSTVHVGREFLELAIRDYYPYPLFIKISRHNVHAAVN